MAASPPERCTAVRSTGICTRAASTRPGSSKTGSESAPSGFTSRSPRRPDARARRRAAGRAHAQGARQSPYGRSGVNHNVLPVLEPETFSTYSIGWAPSRSMLKWRRARRAGPRSTRSSRRRSRAPARVEAFQQVADGCPRLPRARRDVRPAHRLTGPYAGQAARQTRPWIVPVERCCSRIPRSSRDMRKIVAVTRSEGLAP